MLSEKTRRVFKTGHPVNVLIIEDSRDDADLMIRHLRKGGFRPKTQRVESADGLSSALKNDPWDIILCDHNMPGFDSVEALSILNKMDLKVPFLLISDALPDDVAIKLIENGARATLSKHEMGDLVPAVVKELQHSVPGKSKTEVNGQPNPSKTDSRKNGATNGLFDVKRNSDKADIPGKKSKTKAALDSNNGHSKKGSVNINQGSINTVLIVEDEMIQSILLEKLITSLGYEVISKVTTGAEAIEMALDLNPDIITMDISLQDDIDGIMATSSIQKKSMIPVIYISGNSDKYNYERASKTNYIDFIPKPVNREILAKSFSKAESIKNHKTS